MFDFFIVFLIVKWALASIPAIIILATIFSVVTGFMGGMMGGMMRPIQRINLGTPLWIIRGRSGMSDHTVGCGALGGQAQGVDEAQ